ncbi:MAG TPA: hypothetical protein DCG13_01935 [Legionellales bacterium]|nr:hypothetical protein [Legionellales bacterium]HCA89029.1 hypothetical protein [Legionellales bacterium]|tara:strand:+ start:4424 stop:5350 length:927 start_codon:yes stop_codon:yes gene_type:complete
MIPGDFHFLRPYALLGCLPMGMIIWWLWRERFRSSAWPQACDAHLLAFLMRQQKPTSFKRLLGLLLFSSLCFCIALAGPAWQKLPIPTFHQTLPKVVLLDMSSSMAQTDIKPDRFTRAKFKLHDVLKLQDTPALGFMVFSQMPFMLSPLTEDAQTIDELLTSLTLKTLPVGGHNLSLALKKGAKLITQAGFQAGHLLVLTSVPPNHTALNQAQALAHQGIYSSIMPVTSLSNAQFTAFAEAGGGRVLDFNQKASDLKQWLDQNPLSAHIQQIMREIPRWQDEGRYFIALGLLGLLPLFRRQSLQRLYG